MPRNNGFRIMWFFFFHDNKMFLTGNGSFHDAPTIDGLTMQIGIPTPSLRIMDSAKALVKEYVFGHLPMRAGVIASMTSSDIHLEGGIQKNNRNVIKLIFH